MNPDDSPRGALALLVARAHALLGGRGERALAPLGVRSRHVALLNALEAGPSSQRRLGGLLGVDRTTMVGLVEELVRLGLVDRRRDDEDRRRSRVAATPRGAALRVKAHKLLGAVEDELTSGLAPPDRERLVRLLARLVEPPARA
jgi:DNA-binding MarR family transcriptional regulator